MKRFVGLFNNETLQMEKLVLIFIPQFVIVTQYVMYYEMTVFSE